MSDTYNYNSGSPAFGMGGLFGGCGGFGGGFGCNNLTDLIGLAFVAGIFGFGNFGGWGGGFGGGRFGGGQLGADAYAATTAALIQQQQTGERVAGIATGVDAVAGLVTAQGTKLETVKDAVVNGFYANQTNLCQLGNNIAMQAVNNQNATTALLNDMRFASAQCCCDTKQLIQSSFCDLRHQMQMDKCATDALVVAEGEKTRALIRDIDTAKLREELAAAKAKISQDEQTNKILSGVYSRPYGNGGCGSCDPCCQPNACNILAKEIIEAGVNRIVNPPTTATTAA